MKRAFFFAAALFSFGAICTAQNASNNASGNGSAYTIPRIVYVGDTATLVYPLNNLSTVDMNSSVASIVTENLPRTEDITLLKATLDTKASVITIEFRAYKTGTLVIPSFFLGGLTFENISVHVSSIFEKTGIDATLATQAEPLIAPGTIYFIILLFLLGFVSFGIIIVVKAKYSSVFLTLQKKHTQLQMKRFLKRLTRQLVNNKCAVKDALSELSINFRIFLSRYYKLNFISMTPSEFPENIKNKTNDIFVSCDSLRFSVLEPAREAALELIKKTFSTIEMNEENSNEKSPRLEREKNATV
jgi:hypothetical protein